MSPRPRTLADALKRIAVLKREVEATRKRLVKDRDVMLAVADSEHRAMRTLFDEAVVQRDEARVERDANRLRADTLLHEFYKGVEQRDEARRERDVAVGERGAAMEIVKDERARLVIAQNAYSNLRLVCETEHAACMDAEAERDEALDALDAVQAKLMETEAPNT